MLPYYVNRSWRFSRLTRKRPKTWFTPLRCSEPVDASVDVTQMAALTNVTAAFGVMNSPDSLIQFTRSLAKMKDFGSRTFRNGDGQTCFSKGAPEAWEPLP